MAAWVLMKWRDTMSNRWRRGLGPSRSSSLTLSCSSSTRSRGHCSCDSLVGRRDRHAIASGAVTARELWVVFAMADEMLKEMGINLIGPRARLLEELSRLKAQARRVKRETSLWESDQYDGRSECQKCQECNCCCPFQLDHYKLSSAYLVVRRTHQGQCGPFRLPAFCCGGINSTQNSMDLSLIKDVDTATSESGCGCCFTGHDEVRVSTEGTDVDDEEVLHVAPRTGDEIMRTIRNAMEENQIQAMVRI